MGTEAVNARCEDGLVHSCEKHPTLHPANRDHCTRAGFTWCLIFFTWIDGPRFHPESDNVESRLTKTDDFVTCIACLGNEIIING